MVSREPSYCPDCGTALDRRRFDGRERAHCAACERYVFRNPAPTAGVLVCYRGDRAADGGDGNVPGPGSGLEPGPEPGPGPADDGRDAPAPTDDVTRVLLVQRDVPPGVGEWTVPGGHLEYDEPPDEAAVRELREETNLRVTPASLTLLDAQLLGPGGDGPAERSVVSIGFTADWRDVAGVPRAGSDARGVSWFAPSDLAAVTLRPQARRRCARVLDADLA